MPNNNPNLTQSQSQNKQILKYLESGKTLTTAESRRLFECERLSARIFDLKEMGKPIDKKMIVVRSGKRVAQYFLAPQAATV